MTDRDRDDDERPRKSWSEIDKQRNRSRHVSRDPSPGASKRERERSGATRAALEQAFSDGLVGKLVARKEGRAPATAEDRRPELLKKIRITEARAEVNALIDELLSFSDFPDDWDVLVRALDHGKDEVVRRALERIQRLLGHERPPRKAVLAMRLTGIIDNTRDDDLRALAEAVRGAVG